MKYCLGISIVALSFCWSAFAQAQKTTVGWNEQISLYPSGFQVHALLNSATESSLLRVVDIVELKKKEGKEYVRFSVKDHRGAVESFDAPVVRKVKVRTSSGRRYTRKHVTLKFCLADKIIMKEVGLSESPSHTTNIAKLGRMALAGDYLVDPSRAFITTPSCKPEVR